MERFTYRPINDPVHDLRPGERLVQLKVPAGMFSFQGGRQIGPSEVTRYYAERATPFNSRIGRR